MDIEGALRIFGIRNLEELTETNIKRRFRGLMVEHHPDVGGNDNNAKLINEAHEIIKSRLKGLEEYRAVKNKETRVFVVQLDELDRIYNGESIELKDNQGKVNINKVNMGAYRIALKLICRITFRGKETEFTSLSAINNSGEYTLECKIADTDLNSTEDIVIRVLDKEVKATMRNTKLNIKVGVGSTMKLTAIMERVDRDGH